jgi:hypothetical protein
MNSRVVVRFIAITSFFLLLPMGVAMAGAPSGCTGTTTIGAYAPSIGKFFLRNSNDAGGADGGVFKFQQPNRDPVTGNWDGQ